MTAKAQLPRKQSTPRLGPFGVAIGCVSGRFGGGGRKAVFWLSGRRHPRSRSPLGRPLDPLYLCDTSVLGARLWE
ncbi:hypothetical protein BS50DRAFT_47553 [Corynespora cassiicola Philippines]|uniref:Uncharacterized protein n=1 Tax=Corynespora cassiicola Philippines TaxID=1448308 RepID=A0A2T2NHM1_CORCC|nr:hypothetical protein BS50DRAFT_47553 [Corynespora cassiicola Philippines]